KGDKEEVVLEDVDLVMPDGDDQWQLVNIFGEQKSIRARLKKVTLGRHRLLFAPVD
ncbi:MAG: CooT family nickel-binding protein, partial [Deltaproteobacteria bacterium]|nr:CooT family nickel-binding protein [Deltaproteobacteria bacterium]